MKKWQLILVTCGLLALFSKASADDNGVYGYGYWAPKTIETYVDEVDVRSPSTGSSQCSPLYENALNKGSLDIRYALGYFDDSTGEERVFNGVNYGLSPSLDIEIFHALRKELTAPCRHPNLRACGFSESGNPQAGKVILQKYVRLQGKKILVNLTLTQASATASFQENKGPQAQRQSFLTAQSEDNFFNGLKSADIVFYNGHSRNGGGPDFNPPILNSTKHVNYKGYYEVKHPGFLKTMASLKANPNKGIVLGLFSCYSRLHFYKTFLSQNPHQRMVFSAETIDYFDSLRGSVGYLEGIAKQGQKAQQGFQGYNIL